jgi:hypothetical protein
MSSAADWCATPQVKLARFGIGPVLIVLLCRVANARGADQSLNQARQPDAEPTSACESLAQRDFPKVSNSSAWRGKASSWHHVWDCGANESRHYEELYFQLGLAVAGHRITGGLSCDTTSGPLRAPGGGTYSTDSGRSGIITRGWVKDSYYSFHVVFCDDTTQSCDLRGHSLGDILLAGTYDCSRAGKQVDSGIWTVEPLNNGQPNCEDLNGPADFKSTKCYRAWSKLPTSRRGRFVERRSP